MAYEPLNFDHLLGTPGFSDKLFQNHFKLYQGYVMNTNKLLDTLHQSLKEGKMNTPEFAELTRRFGWEFNGMRLHELYFSNLTKEGSDLDEKDPLYKQMKKDFGSGENCDAHFTSVGSMRGIGWTVMCYDPVAKRLFNVWVNEHDVGNLAGTTPILVMDVFEHAYMLDYGTNKVDYITAFKKAINWDIASKRFQHATK